MRKRSWKNIHPTSLIEAFELCSEHATEVRRRPPKALAEYMDVPLSTYYRWISEAAMPAGRIRQFEDLCGVHFVSDYLSLAAGRMVIDIPRGKLPTHLDVGSLNKVAADAISLLLDFGAGKAAAEATAAALCEAAKGFSYQYSNVLKAASPELDLAGGE